MDGVAGPKVARVFAQKFEPAIAYPSKALGRNIFCWKTTTFSAQRLHGGCWGAGQKKQAECFIPYGYFVTPTLFAKGNIIIIQK